MTTHKEKAAELVEQGAKLLDKTKSGHSEAAAQRLTNANKELKAAGLIKGRLQK